MLYLLWGVFALIVGFIGSGRRIGFFFSFLLSVLLSPIIGLIIVLFSKRNEDVKNEAIQKLNNDYSNFANSRNENQNLFKVPDLKDNQNFYRLTAESIPNNEIGKPITIQYYIVSSNKKVKKGKRIVVIKFGDKELYLSAPYDGVVTLFHKKGSFLLPDDPVFIIEKL